MLAINILSEASIRTDDTRCGTRGTPNTNADIWYSFLILFPTRWFFFSIAIPATKNIKKERGKEAVVKTPMET